MTNDFLLLKLGHPVQRKYDILKKAHMEPLFTEPELPRDEIGVHLALLTTLTRLSFGRTFWAQKDFLECSSIPK